MSSDPTATLTAFIVMVDRAMLWWLAGTFFFVAVAINLVLNRTAKWRDLLVWHMALWLSLAVIAGIIVHFSFRPVVRVEIVRLD
jgi:hypothetical protein